MKRVIATLLLLSAPAQVQVSSTAAPVANSSGSVTNQAVQVVPSRTFGFNYSGYLVRERLFTSILSKYNHQLGTSLCQSYYQEPVYDQLDLVGATDPEEYSIPDGQPDNPGNVLYLRPIRTGQKTNYSINGGITATISVPLDRSHVRSCRKAAEKQVALLDAQLADKRLNYEIARLKNCAELMKQGISFHPDSPYASICADVIRRIRQESSRPTSTKSLTKRALKLHPLSNRLRTRLLPKLLLKLFDHL